MIKTQPAGRGGVIQFAKAPLVGRVKTRLQPVLSPDVCQQLHRALCLHTAAHCHKPDLWDYRLCVTEPAHSFWAQAFPGFSIWPQADGDLGARMAHAFERALSQEWDWAVLIGSDCPALGCEHIAHARDELANHDLVLLPAQDGGYALIAMARPLAVFDGIHWGTEQVLRQTLALARQRGLNVALLPTVSDIDRPEDLPQLAQWPALQQFVR